MPDDLRSLQISLTESAGKIAALFKITLDFSESSIQAVDKMAEEIHADFKKTGDRTGLDGIALEFAAYVISVLERHHEKGEWQRDDKEFGKNTFPYLWRGRTLFPVAWCSKRLIDGPTECIWDKYKMLVLEGADGSDSGNV